MSKRFADFNDTKSQLLNHFFCSGFGGRIRGRSGGVIRGWSNDLIRYNIFGRGVIRDCFICVRSYAPDECKHEHAEAQKGKKLFHNEKR